jgi:acyl-CoA thioesterase-1
MRRFLSWPAFLGPALLGLILLGTVGTVRAAPPKTILVLGDSLSAAHNIPVESGWVHLLSDRLSKMEPAWAVVNASISGETSLGGRKRLPALLDKAQPAVVVIELGANDGLRGLSLPALRENLAAMIDAARQAKAQVLVLGIELPPNYGPQYRDGLRAVYADLSQQNKVALVPFLLDGVAQRPELMQQDGLHPTAAAQPQVLANVWKQLEPLLR